MQQILAITLKELKSYFVSPIAYVVIAMFLAMSGFFYVGILFSVKDASMMRHLFSNMSVILMLLSPLISMRLLAEENRSKTIELLFTSPISDAGIILGKFLAAASLLLIMMLCTVHFPLILMIYGEPDIWPILAGYVGIFLIGTSYLAIGMLTSSWTQNQIIAGAVAFSISLILMFMGVIGNLLGPEMGGVLNYLGLFSHFDSFSKGVLTASDLLYYLTLIGIVLFLTTRSLETRRWR